ncbi:MAG: MFS transporter [Oscillospiraceae bacterium]|jgi:PPP family 3-phenylpropionic acid transporter|nr:MFS transporter [Oscillospiraceae bacterium]
MIDGWQYHEYNTTMSTVKTLKSRIRPYTAFLLFNLVFFMMDTAGGYFNMYLDGIGMSKTSIGLVTSISALVAMMFQPALGGFADRAKSKTRTLAGAILLTALLYPMLLISKSIWWLLPAYTIYSIFRRFQPSLNTSISLEFSEVTGGRYGPIRMMGAIGYAGTMAVMGGIADLGVNWTFWAYTVVCLINVGAIMLLPDIGLKESATVRSPTLALLRRKPVLKLVVYAMLMSLAQGLFFSYFSIYLTQDLGGSPGLYGMILSAAAVCEIPFLFFADRILRKLGAKRMLLLIGLTGSLRWFCTYWVQDPVMQTPVQSLNFLNILRQVTVSLVLSRMVPPQFKTTAQTIVNMVMSIASLTVSSLLGGVLADALGIRPLFLIAGVLTCVTAVGFHVFVFGNDLTEDVDYCTPSR